MKRLKNLVSISLLLTIVAISFYFIGYKTANIPTINEDFVTPYDFDSVELGNDDDRNLDATIIQANQSYEQHYSDLNLDGSDKNDDEVYISVYSWDDTGYTDTLVVYVKFGNGESTAYTIPPSGYPYSWGYSLYTGNLFSTDRDAIVIEIPVPNSTYGAADIFVLDIYGTSNTEPPIIIERLNTISEAVKLPSGIDISLEQLFTNTNFTDGIEIKELSETELQGITLYNSIENDSSSRNQTTIYWTNDGFIVSE